MTNEEAIKTVQERAKELSENPAVKRKGFEIFQKEGGEAANEFLFNLAIATLYFTPEEFKQYAEKQAIG